MKPSVYEQDAVVVYERHSTFNESCGPVEFGKVGVAFGSDVWWTANWCFPGDSMEAYGIKIGFATELARRWNSNRP